MFFFLFFFLFFFFLLLLCFPGPEFGFFFGCLGYPNQIFLHLYKYVNLYRLWNFKVLGCMILLRGTEKKKRKKKEKKTPLM